MEIIVFVLDHQDGQFEYALERSGFCVEDGKLFISIECRAIKEDTFPDSYHFAIGAYPMPSAVEPQIINLQTSLDDDESPSVAVYTTFHASQVDARLEVKAATSAWMDIDLRVVTEDVNYYDDRAKRTPFHGSCRLMATTRESLWLPL
jgi:hypothetical protein